jgi:hypothetical protein
MKGGEGTVWGEMARSVGTEVGMQNAYVYRVLT